MFTRKTPKYEVAHPPAHPDSGASPSSTPDLRGVVLERDARKIFEKSEEGIRVAAPLLSWFRSELEAQRLPLFEICRSPVHHAQGFLDEIELNGRRTTVMGCIQRFIYRCSAAPSTDAPPTTLSEFANSRFFEICECHHPDGAPGGFTFRPLLGKLKPTGTCCRLPEPGDRPQPDLGTVGRRYDWITYQISINDFVRNIPQMRWCAGALSRIVKEDMYVSVEPSYLMRRAAREQGILDEYEIGYAFVPEPVHGTIFGFGPGRFSCGFKLWRFALRDTGDLELFVVFVTSPRSERLLYLWGFDPLYSMVDVVDGLTLGRWHLRQRAHDKADRSFLRQHVVCHEKAMEQMRTIFENTNWVAEPDRPSGANA